MIEYKLATKDEVEVYKALWKECFPADAEEHEYIDDFFNTFFIDADDPADIVTARFVDESISEEPVGALCTGNDAEIISMAVLIPVKLKLGDKLYDIYYLYAMCNKEKMRHQGIGLDLLKFADEVARGKNKAGIALLPANIRLPDFYNKAGYAACLVEESNTENVGAVIYPDSYMDFVHRYTWSGYSKGVLGMFNGYGLEIEGKVWMPFPLS